MLRYPRGAGSTAYLKLPSEPITSSSEAEHDSASLGFPVGGVFRAAPDAIIVNDIAQLLIERWGAG